MRSKTRTLEEEGELRDKGEGEKEGIDGIQGEFHIGMEE
jgi:hypothetical protein